MTPGLIIKKIWSIFLLKSGYLDHRLKGFNTDYNIILTYHRIIPKKKVPPNLEPGMYVTPATFRNHIKFLKKYFSISPIEQFISNPRTTPYSISSSSKPNCVISFDDGWRDFYIYAWPIIKAEQIPVVVFLPTGFIGTKNKFWTDRLKDLLSKGGQYHVYELLNLNKEKFSPILRHNFQRVFITCINELKRYPSNEIARILDESEKRLSISTQLDRSFMDWNEIRELFATGLVSFGSHTVNHEILTNITNEQIQHELKLSKDKLLAEKVTRSNIPFCYPNGNYSGNIARLVQDQGYSLAVTCIPGINAPTADKFTLKRVSLHQDISSSTNLFACRLAKCTA